MKDIPYLRLNHNLVNQKMSSLQLAQPDYLSWQPRKDAPHSVN